MLNYQNGKIYKLVCNNTGKQYIGSTTQKYLSQRLTQHKLSSNICKSKEIIEGGNYSIVLVELFPCNSKDEINKRERHFIETLECVNKYIPGRTKKEYHEDNKEKMDEYKKEYYQLNKEKIKQQKNQKYNCECGGKYTYSYKSKHMKSKKHLKYLDDN